MSKKQNKESFSDWLEKLCDQQPTSSEVSAVVNEIKEELSQETKQKIKGLLRDKYRCLQIKIQEYRDEKRRSATRLEGLKLEMDTIKAQVEDILKGNIE